MSTSGVMDRLSRKQASLDLICSRIVFAWQVCPMEFATREAQSNWDVMLMREVVSQFPAQYSYHAANNIPL